MKIPSVIIALAASLSVAAISACGGDSSGDHDDEDERKPALARVTVKPTGKVVNVEMITDGKGERYDPKEVRVMPGDSLAFVLKSGVHNFHFPAAKNPAGVTLPPMSEYLQLPGQKKTIFIDFPEGHYYYQCDIHVMLGMFGTVHVEDDDR